MTLLPLRALFISAALVLFQPWATALAQETASGQATATPEAAAPAPAEALARIDYVSWNKVAQRAEQALEAGRASDQALQNLRAEIVGWRDQFSKAKAENTIRITTLKTQIGTLGPRPTEGATEPAILTQRRDELTVELEALEAPVKEAELAFSRANALVAGIDGVIRSRQADLLFQLGPTPLNPANWPKAAGDLANTLKRAWSGMTSSWGTETQRAELRRDLPVTLFLAVVALVLLGRGRTWVVRAGAGLRTRSHGPASEVLGFLVSLGQVAAPLLGVYALVEALNSAGVLGLRAQVFADSLPAMGLSFFSALWLGNRVFGVGSAALPGLGDAQRAEGRIDAATLGFLYGFSLLLDRVAEYEAYGVTTSTILTFPVLVAGGVLLFRLGRLLNRHGKSEAEKAESGTFRIQTVLFLGRVLQLIGLAGPAVAAVGYGSLAASFIFPTALTTALVAMLSILNAFFVAIYALILRVDEQKASDALGPVLASFFVTLLAIPVLALIWGARVTDLAEIWSAVMQGFTIGGTRITPGSVLMLVIIFGAGFALTRLVQGMLKSTILPKTGLDVGGQNAITSGIGYVGIFLAALLAITSAGFDLSSLAIVAGALSVGIGFGLQNVVSNFVSGIILLIERPIGEGDWIEVGGHSGYVRDISVRSTRIETFDRSDVIIPNSDLISGVVTNYTRGNLLGRVIVPVGVAYGTDTREVERILREIADAHPLVSMNPEPSVVFKGFGADSLDFEIRAILKDVNYVMKVRSDLNHEIARRFVEAGIEIPFAQRDIWIRNPEALAQAPILHKMEIDDETVESTSEEAGKSDD